MGKWVTLIKKDYSTKEFFPLKLLYFFMSGGMCALFPFLTIQARSLGITGEELGLIYGIFPLIGIFAPAIAGLLADKIGNFKIYLSLSVTCSGLAALLFLAIPPCRVEHEMPVRLPLKVECLTDRSNLTIHPSVKCDINNKIQSTLIDISTCYYDCSHNLHKLQDADKLLENWCSSKGNCETVYENVVISQLNNTSCSNCPQHEQYQNNYYYIFSNSTVPIKLFTSNSISTMIIDDNFCPKFKQFSDSIVENPTSENNFTSKCRLRCKASMESRDFCTNKYYTETINPTFTIITYIIVRVINSLTLAISFTMFGGAVVSILKEHNGDLGLQKMYSNLGQIVFTPISGKLIDYFSNLNGKEDYRSAFFLYCGIKLFCAFLFLFVNLEFKKPSNRVVQDFKELIVQPPVALFILYTIVVGTCYGFIETFLFWILDDLGASKSLMGMTVTIGAIFGIPLMMTSSFVIDKLGHVNTLTLCSSVYVIRLIGYSFIKNPWLAMPFEALESITNSLLSVVCVSYAAALSTASTVASLQGLYEGTFHGIGKGTGSFFGGLMMKHLGSSGSFRVLGVICGIFSILYIVVNKLLFSKRKYIDLDEELDDDQNVDNFNQGNEQSGSDKLINESSVSSYGTRTSEPNGTRTSESNDTHTSEINGTRWTEPNGKIPKSFVEKVEDKF